MELTSQYFDLTGELMEYLTRGDGTYPVDESETNCKLISVKTALSIDEDQSVSMIHLQGEPIQFYADIHFVLSDESRGTVQVCFAPSTIMLINFKPVKLEEGCTLADKLAEVRDEIEKEGPTMNEENTTLWSKSLIKYVSQGAGTHNPNFVDSILGMNQVMVKWFLDSDTKKLINFGDEEALVYQCQVAYGTEDGVSGSIVFQVMPYEIDFSS